MKAFLGIDVGSVSTNLALLGADGQVVQRAYLRTHGQPIRTLLAGLKQLKEHFSFNSHELTAVGTTGSARYLAAALVGADVVKNEITAHAVAAAQLFPQVQTVLEIGGQDSKIIIIREGVVVDFAMNTVCAAGTGSFLDQQASRLGIPIEEFGHYAHKSVSPVKIAGRCTVFAESDMVHKQQLGHPVEDIVAGLCEALVRNYLSNVAKGKELQPPFVFQGGVAANAGIKKAFERALGCEVLVPPHYDVMGAIGAAFLAQEAIQEGLQHSRFKGFEISDLQYQSRGFTCTDCANACEIAQVSQGENIVACWGSRCGKWDEGKSSV